MTSEARIAKLKLIEKMDDLRQKGLAAGDEKSLWIARLMEETIATIRGELAAQ